MWRFGCVNKLNGQAILLQTSILSCFLGQFLIFATTYCADILYLLFSGIYKALLEREPFRSSPSARTSRETTSFRKGKRGGDVYLIEERTDGESSFPGTGPMEAKHLGRARKILTRGTRSFRRSEERRTTERRGRVRAMN